MTDTDTSPEAVERLARHTEDASDNEYPYCQLIGAALRALSAERTALKAELAEAVGALQNIESRPDKMTWGEDYEVSEAMRDMEETARAFLARHRKETGT